MNKELVARELAKIASLLLSTEFGSQKELDEYLKEHPAADKSNHSVKKDEDDEAANKEIDERQKKHDSVRTDVENDLHSRANKKGPAIKDDDNHNAVKKHAEKLVKTMGGPKARAVSKNMKNQAEDESAIGTDYHKNKRVLHNMLHEQVKRLTPTLTNHS